MPVISRPGDGPQGGQSVVEFAILLPLLVALVGLAIDVARVYEAWTGLEAGTRDAAEYLARSSDDPLALDYGGSNTSAKAKYVLERETGVVFALDANQAACNSAKVTASYAESTSAAEGGSTAFPVGIGTVRACQPFRALFAYPLLTQDGNWLLRSERTYRVLVGR